jgi:hypothetical protein
VIHITESNANASDDAARPAFFSNLASWLNSNGGADPDMLTFFPKNGGSHSVPWPPSTASVIALQHIQATYG